MRASLCAWPVTVGIRVRNGGKGVLAMGFGL